MQLGARVWLRPRPVEQFKAFIKEFVDLRFSKMVDAARGVWVYVRERFESATASIVLVIVLVLESEDPMLPVPCSSGATGSHRLRENHPLTAVTTPPRVK